MPSFRPTTLHLLIMGVTALPHAHALETYTEANFPKPLMLKPGITQSTGGITSPDQLDDFFYRTSYSGSVTARVRYLHRNANIFTGTTELPHLAGKLDFGYFIPPDTFFEGLVGPSVALGSTFFVINGTNTIHATVPALTGVDETTRLRVSAPPGKIHPDYTVEFDYQPTRDPWESGGSNESAATAVVIDPATPGNLDGGTHGADDNDWFRFTVPPGRSLQLGITSAVLNVPWGILPHLCVLHNVSGIPLQTGNTGNVTFIENSGPSAQTYLLRITSQDEYPQGWNLTWGLQDALEPNNTPAQARSLGTLHPQGRIEIPDLTMLDADHYTIMSGLPAGTRILIAALPDPLVSTRGSFRVMLQSGVVNGQEYGNYSIVTTSENGVVGFRLADTASRYKLFIKPCSAYDDWQRDLGLENTDFPNYLPATSDFDGDGIPAALERSLRLSPFVANTGALPPPFFDGSAWRVNLPMPQGGAATDIFVTESEDLVHWAELPGSRTNLGASTILAGRTAGAVFVLSRPGASRNFLRFSVND